jgi:hypothetical protein
LNLSSTPNFNLRFLHPDFLANVELEAKVIATLQKAEDYILHLKEQHHQHLLEATNRQ